MRKTVVAIISIAAFAVGLVTGGVGAMVYLGNFVGESLISYKQMQFAVSSEKAFDAYRNQEPSVAIYALSRHLEKLDETEELTSEGRGLVSENDINFDRMITHGRLGKVHEALGNEGKASDHVARAIAFAEDTGLQVDDKDRLMDLVDRADRQEETS